MPAETRPTPQSRARPTRNLQFDLLRIFFATVVLLSHAPEIIDGDRSRELFSHFTRTPVSFGIFAVDGFFLISGYFILKSWQRDPSAPDYLLKRILRIVPGYAAAVALAILAAGIFAPGVPNFFRSFHAPDLLRSVFTLDIPATPPVFPTAPHDRVVNGSLWTIGYEFRCYLLVALLGVLGLLRSRTPWLILTILLLPPFFSPELRAHLIWHRGFILLGDSSIDLRLVPIFLIGGCYHLFRKEIPFRPTVITTAVAAIPLAAWLAPQRFEFFLVLCGSYLLFAFGAMPAPRWLAPLHHLPDISYGIYLYGWPVEIFLIVFLTHNPWLVFALSVPLCFLLGWLSWTFIESPMLKLKPRGRRPGAPFIAPLSHAMSGSTPTPSPDTSAPHLSPEMWDATTTPSETPTIPA